MQPKEPRTCPQCHKEFVPVRKGQCCSEECRKNFWYSNHKREMNEARRAQKAEIQGEMFPARKSSKCNCGDYTHCLVCRNAERRRAFKADEVPVYRLAIMQMAAGD